MPFQPASFFDQCTRLEGGVLQLQFPVVLLGLVEISQCAIPFRGIDGLQPVQASVTKTNHIDGHKDDNLAM